MSEELKKKARMAMLEGNLSPMAQWLRTHDDLNLRLLAMAVETGNLTLNLTHKERKAALWLEVGKWISDKEASGVPSASAIAEASERFPVSKRTAERCKAEWQDWGKEAGTALQFLASHQSD